MFARKQNNKPGKKLTRWSNLWPLIPILLVGLLSPLLMWSNWLYLGVAIAGVSLSIAALLVWIHLRYWPPNDDHFCLDGDRLYQGGRLFSAPKPNHRPETWAAYRSICRQYVQLQKQHAAETQYDYAAALDISRPQLNRALQAWRVGWLDDRPWYHRLNDHRTGRSRSDATRYLPPD